MNSYDVGDEVKLTAEFVNDTGSPTDPDAVTLRVRGGSTVTDYTVGGGITHTGTGSFTALIPVTVPGTWIYRWSGTANPKTTEEGRFFVRTPTV